jgi:SET domain-containing protein
MFIVLATTPNFIKLPPTLYAKEVIGKGKGIFSQTSIAKGDTIEVCHTLKVPVEQSQFIEKTILKKYAYVRNDEGWSVVLGYGMLYNHSYHPNAQFVWDKEENFVNIVALRDIEADEEIVFNYHGDPDCMDPMWFDCEKP